MVKGRNIVLKRVDNRIYLPTTEPIDGIAPSSIPAIPYIMCRIEDYDPQSGIMELKYLPERVNEYLYNVSVEVNSSLFLSINIKKLVFTGIAIKPSLASHYPTSRVPKFDYDLSGDDDVLPLKRKQYNPPPPKPISVLPEPKDLVKEVTKTTDDISIKDLKFLDGEVCFNYYVYAVHRMVSFSIHNPSIRKEYDSVKNYFAKVLGTKKVTVTLEVESIQNSILTQLATSPQIQQINDSLFELVEELYTEDVFLSNSNDEVYSLPERAKLLAEKIGSEHLKDPEWLLNKLIKKERTKHYYHLRYLSSKHLSDKFNLRLTGKPLSFVFLLQSSNNYYLIWETYATQEATYIWKLANKGDSELSEEVTTLIDQIKLLRRSNKLAYIRTKPVNFTRIEHEYSGEDMGFKKWKAQLNQFLNTTGSQEA